MSSAHLEIPSGEPKGRLFRCSSSDYAPAIYTAECIVPFRRRHSSAGRSLRGIFNEAIEMGIVDVNPAARLGRFTRIAKTAEVKGISLTSTEADQFLRAAKEICPEYHPLFLMALRAGLRRGELVAVQWGDIQFGKDDQDPNRTLHCRRAQLRTP